MEKQAITDPEKAEAMVKESDPTTTPPLAARLRLIQSWQGLLAKYWIVLARKLRGFIAPVNLGELVVDRLVHPVGRPTPIFKRLRFLMGGASLRSRRVWFWQIARAPLEPNYVL